MNSEKRQRKCFYTALTLVLSALLWIKISTYCYIQAGDSVPRMRCPLYRMWEDNMTSEEPQPIFITNNLRSQQSSMKKDCFSRNFISGMSHWKQKDGNSHQTCRFVAKQQIIHSNNSRIPQWKLLGLKLIMKKQINLWLLQNPVYR